MSEYRTHSEIIDAIRLKCARAYWSEDSLHPNGDIPEITCLEPHKLATQLESAHKREVDDLKNQIALLSKTPGNDNSATATVTGGECGNSAKLRDALSKFCAYSAEVLNTGKFDRVPLEALFNMARAALAAPPRNCDIYPTVEEAYEKYMGVPMSARNYFVEWLIATEKESEVVDGGK